jgi:hypothetical protein
MAAVLRRSAQPALAGRYYSLAAGRRFGGGDLEHPGRPLAGLHRQCGPSGQHRHPGLGQLRRRVRPGDDHNVALGSRRSTPKRAPARHRVAQPDSSSARTQRAEYSRLTPSVHAAQSSSGAARSEARTRAGAASGASRLDQLEPDSSAGCGQSGIARAVASSGGRRVACILMFRALQCDDCGLCYRRGADGPLGRRSGCWYWCCLSE